MKNIDKTFAALAEPTRRQVVELLGSGPRRAHEIAERSGMSRAAMSRHLRVLRSSGLVEVETPAADARARVYRLRADRLLTLQAWLEQMQEFWGGQLEAFKEHAERTRGAKP